MKKDFMEYIPKIFKISGTNSEKIELFPLQLINASAHQQTQAA
jgi:hypothetical protein